MQVAATKIVKPSAAAPKAQTTPPTYLDPDVISERIRQGRVAEHSHGKIPPALGSRTAPSYFRTYEQVRDAMKQLAEQYPDLVQLHDLGDSWEKTQGKADRDILALTITNRKTGGAIAKPIMTSIAGVHAREIANPEMLMTFAKQLVEGYGRDAEITALLDSREIDLVPMVNPDGHAYIERGYTGAKNGDLMKRKNASGPDGSGTDVNRNFDYHWGGAGASSNPRSDTYRGASAASEFETKAVQEFVARRKPGVFIDWHSYSRLNLYPWGDTKAKAPDHAGLKAVAEKFSTFNHYSPIQAVDLYPTTGTTDDFAYGKLGVPSWAVETGGTFHQTDKEFTQTLSENIPVLFHAAKIADKPFERVMGPDIVDLFVDPGTGEVSFRATESTSGGQAIKGAELVIDTETPNGSGIKLEASDGEFNAVDEHVVGSIRNVNGLRLGDGRLVYVRAQDLDGNWGPLSAQWINGIGRNS